MADVQPFRAVRYSGAAGAPADLVAPPYDAVSDDERAQLYTRSPYNVVYVTLPESADEAGRTYRDWLEDGILEQDDAASVWLAVEDFVGPDGVARERRGVIVSLAATPYEAGGVLPHERTHPRIRAERKRLLDATRVQPEPILLLADIAARPFRSRYAGRGRRRRHEAVAVVTAATRRASATPSSSSPTVTTATRAPSSSPRSSRRTFESWLSSCRRRMPACNSFRHIACSRIARMSRVAATWSRVRISTRRSLASGVSRTIVQRR